MLQVLHEDDENLAEDCMSRHVKDGLHESIFQSPSDLWNHLKLSLPTFLCGKVLTSICFAKACNYLNRAGTNHCDPALDKMFHIKHQFIVYSDEMKVG